MTTEKPNDETQLGGIELFISVAVRKRSLLGGLKVAMVGFRVEIKSIRK